MCVPPKSWMEIFSMGVQERPKMFKQALVQFLRDEEGVVTIEYALMAALVAVGLIVTLLYYRENIKELFGQIGSVTDTVTAGVAAVNGSTAPTTAAIATVSGASLNN